MNIEHFQYTINQLKFVAKDNHFNLNTWVSRGIDEELVTNTKELIHTCGATACIGGYLSFSKEYRKWANYPKEHNGGVPSVFTGNGRVESYDALDLYWETHPAFTILIACPDYQRTIYNTGGGRATRKQVYKKLERILHRYKTDKEFAALVDTPKSRWEDEYDQLKDKLLYIINEI